MAMYELTPFKPCRPAPIREYTVLLAVTILFLTTIFVHVADWLSPSIPRWDELKTVDIGLAFKYQVKNKEEFDHPPPINYMLTL
jgi:hypothetical protein